MALFEETQIDDLGDGDERPLPMDELIALVLGAPRRHPWIAAGAFFVTATICVALAVLKPPTYTAMVTIEQRRANRVERVANNNHEDELPTVSPADDVMRRENILALIRDAQLVERWDVDRSRGGRLRDKIFGAPTQSEKLKAMIGSLEKKLSVTQDGAVVTIQADWPADETVYRIVTLAQQRFFAERLKSDTSMIRDGIAILQSYIDADRGQVDQALSELDAAQKKQAAEALANANEAPVGAPPKGGKTEAGYYRSAPAAATVDPDLLRRVEEQRHAILLREEDRQHRLAEAKAQLADLRSTLAPAHPSVIALERKVESLSHSSEEGSDMLALNALLKPAQKEGARASVYAAAVENGEASKRSDGKNVIVVGPSDDAATLAAKARIQDAITRYGDLRGSLRAAQVELDVAQAAFKYKYSVITPAEVPEKPKAPSPSMIGLFGILGALLLSFIVPAVVDLASGWFAKVWRKSKLDPAIHDHAGVGQAFERTIFQADWPQVVDDPTPRLEAPYEAPALPHRLTR